MKILLSILFLTISVLIYSSEVHIVGKIIDCSSKEELFLVNVGLLGTTKGATTNENGEFILTNVEEGNYILAVSALGYEDKQVSINLNNYNNNELVIPICEKSIDLEQVVVTGTRTERTLKDVPIQTQLISSKSIERMQICNFKDLLEYELPGVEFTNNGGFANINMLGFSGKYVLFLIDGERMAGETFDNIDYNRIDMDNIKRVEIVKGANSSLYGSNAVGGVINIISKKPQKPIEASANIRNGSNNEQAYRISLGSNQKWGYANFTTSIKSIDPYLLKDSEPLTRHFENGREEVMAMQETYIAGFKDYSITPKVGINLSKKTDIEIKGGYFFKERNPGGLSGTKVADDYHNYSGGIKGEYRIDKKQNISFSTNYDRYDKLISYKLLNEKEKNYENKHTRVASTYNYNWDNGHTLISGIDYFSDNLMTHMFESSGDNINKSAQTYSIYAQQEVVINKQITLVGGARYDYHSQFKGHFTPRLSAMIKPTPILTLRGGYSGGFRSPTLKELYTDWFHPDGGGFQIIGNRDMRAEKSDNFNLSAEVDLGRTVFTAMAQYSFIDDMVNSVWVNNDTVIYANIGKAEVLSTELTLTTRISDNTTFKGGYSYVYDNLGENSVVRPHTATGRIDQTLNIFKKYNPTVSVSGKYFSNMDIFGRGDSDDVSTEFESDDGELYRVKYDAYSIFKITISQSLPLKFRINAGINNIFDYKPKFSSFYSSISPGRTFYAEVKWRF